MLSVLGFGALLRLLTQIAYGPALYYYDSVSYVERADHDLFLSPDQPAGYPLAIRIVRSVTGSLGGVTVVQHLAGLATGLLVYVIVWRLTDRKLLATAGAAVVVLDGYAIAIEQYVMSEALFDLLLIGSASLALLGRRRVTLVASGLLLAAACTVRPVGLFCVPIWLGFVFWRYRRSLAVVICATSVLAPLAAYAAANEIATGNFAFTEDTAWLVYGRIGAIGTCKGLSLPMADRILCPHGPQTGRSVAFYLFAAESPAVRAFGPHSVNAPPRVDRLLFDYSWRVVSQRPLQYVERVTRDLLRFFLPGTRSDYPTEDGPITLPKPGPWLWPFYRPRQHWPASLLRAYVGVFHTIRPFLAILGLVGVLGLALKTTAAVPVGELRRPAITLLLCMGAALMLGSVLSHFERRYGLPVVPLLAAGGLLGAASAWERTAVMRERTSD